MISYVQSLPYLVSPAESVITTFCPIDSFFVLSMARPFAEATRAGGNVAVKGTSIVELSKYLIGSFAIDFSIVKCVQIKFVSLIIASRR